MEGFIKMVRNIPDWLEQHPEAFHLLAYIVRRARRTSGAATFRGETVELDFGEFIIGRTSASDRLGISERKYRTAYKVLVKNKQILTIRTTNRYTIGKLISSLIFDINSEDRRPTERPLGDQQATTNKNEKKNADLKTPNVQGGTSPVHEEIKVPPEFADDVFQDENWGGYSK